MAKRRTTALSSSLARLWTDCLMLGIESQTVIGLRMAKMAWGGAASRAEAHRMVAEKVTAAIDLQQKTAANLIAGKGGLDPAHAVRAYRRRVRANRKRLIKGN